MKKDFTKNVYYKAIEVKKKKSGEDLLVAIRLKDENNNEYTWWPATNSLYEALSTIISIQKQHKEKKEELRKILKILEGKL